MKCQKCKSNRIIKVIVKCSDCCYIQSESQEYSDYVPTDIGLGNSKDYVNFELCLNCGQQQGKWPLKKAALEYNRVLALGDSGLFMIEALDGFKFRFVYEAKFVPVGDDSLKIKLINLHTKEIKFFTGPDYIKDCAKFVNCRPGDLNW
jgi:hypothetical protein